METTVLLTKKPLTKKLKITNSKSMKSMLSMLLCHPEKENPKNLK